MNTKPAFISPGMAVSLGAVAAGGTGLLLLMQELGKGAGKAYDRISGNEDVDSHYAAPPTLELKLPREPKRVETLKTAGALPFVLGAAATVALPPLLVSLYQGIKEREMKKKLEKAESNYSRAVNKSLKSTGLRFQLKDASTNPENFTDVELGLILLDHHTEFTKRAALPTWLYKTLIYLGGATAVAGAGLGYATTNVENPHTQTIKNIRERRLLEEINSPQAPVLTIAPVREMAREDRDGEDD